MTSTQINWPAILKYSGANELVYIASQAEWDNDIDLHVCIYATSDRLIDSQGMIYSLQQCENQFVTPQPTGQAAPVADVIELVKAHLSELGSCCVSQMFAPSVAAAIEMAIQDDA